MQSREKRRAQTSEVYVPDRGARRKIESAAQNPPARQTSAQHSPESLCVAAAPQVRRSIEKEAAERDSRISVTTERSQTSRTFVIAGAEAAWRARPPERFFGCGVETFADSITTRGKRQQVAEIDKAGSQYLAGYPSWNMGDPHSGLCLVHVLPAST